MAVRESVQQVLDRAVAELGIPGVVAEVKLQHRFDAFTTEELLRVAVSQPPVGAPGERFDPFGNR
ncbi:hypothetical protein [Nonomuraea sp. NPDC052265]|uniref:hypothetical protein n=1 Tax=Nonomuraea sp. NPDC052265 TaxID=3364374 RepID=UPI0037C99899